MLWHTCQKSAPKNGTRKIRYQIACQTRQKPVTVFSADFWYVCQCLSYLQRANKHSHKDDRKHPDKPPGSQHPSLLSYMGRLESGPRLLGRIGSGVWISTCLKKYPRPGFCPTTAKRGYDLGYVCSGVRPPTID